MKDLFDYDDYRAYLLDWIELRPNNGRGARAELARAMGSPVSHISQVLGNSTEFTLEQGESLNQHLGHKPDECDFFLLLLQKSRAGTPALKRRVESQIERIRERRLVLKNRLEVKKTISNEHQARFYSSWIYAAVHVALTIRKLQRKEDLAAFFQLEGALVSEVLDFLVSIGLVHQMGGRFVATETRMHLASDSPMISKHHINWRLQSIQSLEKVVPGSDLHYSSVVTIANSDVAKIKSVLIKAIENAKQIIRDSPEEELYSLDLDFFKVR